MEAASKNPSPVRATVCPSSRKNREAGGTRWKIQRPSATLPAIRKTPAGKAVKKECSARFTNIPAIHERHEARERFEGETRVSIPSNADEGIKKKD